MSYTLKVIKNKRDFIFRNIESTFIGKDTCQFPDFLIIGAQKAGTTWLYDVLQQFEDVYFPFLEGKHDPTEVRYFDERLFYPLKWYNELYAGHEEKVKGDKTPKYYLLSVEKIKLIKKLMPHVKILFILRNPVERAWSQCVMNLKKFDKIDITNDKEAYLRFLKKNIKKGFYSQYIKNWQSVFPQEQFKIFLYDDLKNNPDGLLKSIIDFLDLNTEDAPVIDFKKKINANPITKMPDDIRSMLLEAYRNEINVLQKEYHLNVSHWLEEKKG